MPAATRVFPVLLALGAALCLVAGTAAIAQTPWPVATFVDKENGVSFNYPAHFKPDPLYQGATTMVGVTDSSMDKGDISFRFLTGEALLPRFDEGDADRFAQALRAQLAETLPRGKYLRSAPARLLAHPAAEVVYQYVVNRASPRPLQLRLVGTVIEGKSYYLRCSYPVDLAAEYDSACDHIRDSARRP